MSGRYWSLTRIWNQIRSNGNETGCHQWTPVVVICRILDPIRDTAEGMVHKPNKQPINKGVPPNFNVTSYLFELRLPAMSKSTNEMPPSLYACLLHCVVPLPHSRCLRMLKIRHTLEPLYKETVLVRTPCRSYMYIIDRSVQNYH